jgi:DNA-binding NarL/FixJ family response regulator
MKVRIGLVDDHPLFCQGLEAVLSRRDDFEIVGQASTSNEAIDLARGTPMDLVIVDILMPGVSGLTLMAELYELQPACRVLCLSVIDEPCIIADTFRARASGYALKTQSCAEIIGAIDQVLGGVRYLPPSIPVDHVDAMLTGTLTHPFARLTRREREVFELLIRGNTNEEIALKLFIARRTAETHRQRVMNKLAAHSVVQLQRLAARYGGLA